MKKTSLKERTVDILGLPKDLLLGAMNITLTGKYDVYIENYNSIIEYSDNVIKINGKGSNVKIIGKSLIIDSYTKREMRIIGIIKEIVYF